MGKKQQALAQFTVDESTRLAASSGDALTSTVVDGASDPATAAKIATQLINENTVDMVIGGVTSAERAAVKTIIAACGRTLYIWPASYEGGECDPNVWSVGAVPNQQVNPTVNYLLAKGAKTFYLCGNDYSYPRNVLKAARARIEAGGGRVVGEDYIPITATDAPELVTKILRLKPDAVFEIVILPATVPFIKGVVDGGYKGMIAGTLFDQTINPLLGKYAQGLICAQEWFLAFRMLSRSKRQPVHAEVSGCCLQRGFRQFDLVSRSLSLKDAVERAGFRPTSPRSTRRWIHIRQLPIGTRWCLGRGTVS